ncbi:MAG: transcription antitermination factor NusB [Planctomycetota bacterium]|nr:transcription antitermination factor NusB [Planctomycetota bacterium]
MPNLHKNVRGAGYSISTALEGQDTIYRVSEEGERFLVAVLNLKDGDPVRQADLALLLDRGWAVIEAPPADEAPPPPPPVAKPVAPPTPPRRAESGRPAATRRTRGREVALQILYQMEQNSGDESRQIDTFLKRRLRDEKIQDFARALVTGVLENQARIDELISEAAENWRIDRMAAIDRNILRLGVYEMLYDKSVPTKVAINEALELAKRYSTAQSSRFVNGILDRLQDSDVTAPVEPPATAEPPTPEPAE